MFCFVLFDLRLPAPARPRLGGCNEESPRQRSKSQCGSSDLRSSISLLHITPSYPSISILNLPLLKKQASAGKKTGTRGRELACCGLMRKKRKPLLPKPKLGHALGTASAGATAAIATARAAANTTAGSRKHKQTNKKNKPQLPLAPHQC